MTEDGDSIVNDNLNIGVLFTNINPKILIIICIRIFLILKAGQLVIFQAMI